MCRLKTYSWDQLSTNGYIPLSTIGSLSIVADGMGGANAGEIASNLVVKSIKNLLRQRDMTILLIQIPKYTFF